MYLETSLENILSHRHSKSRINIAYIYSAVNLVLKINLKCRFDGNQAHTQQKKWKMRLLLMLCNIEKHYSFKMSNTQKLCISNAIPKYHSQFFLLKSILLKYVSEKCS